MTPVPPAPVKLADALMPGALRAKRVQCIYWSTILLQSRLPNMRGSVVVLGYMGSGTNWLVSLMSDYLNLPPFEPWMRLTPQLTPCVIHMHRFLDAPAARARTIYMHRDGRDAVISAYHKYINTASLVRTGQAFERDTGVRMDADKVADQFPIFLEWFIAHPQPASAPWPDHVRAALNAGYPRISFERMTADTTGALAPVLEDFTGQPVDLERLDRVVQAHSFDRKRKVTDNNRFMRKGTVGEWRTLFDRKARRIFDNWAGDELIALGYERDRRWVNAV